MKGGAYFKPDPRYYDKTLIKNFRAEDTGDGRHRHP